MYLRRTEYNGRGWLNKSGARGGGGGRLGSVSDAASLAKIWQAGILSNSWKLASDLAPWLRELEPERRVFQPRRPVPQPKVGWRYPSAVLSGSQWKGLGGRLGAVLLSMVHATWSPIRRCSESWTLKSQDRLHLGTRSWGHMEATARLPPKWPSLA